MAAVKHMTDAQWREFVMSGTRTGKLAVTRADGRPHVTPLWFVLDGDDVVFTTYASGVKARSLRHWAAVLGGRYMGADRAEEFAARNGVPGELLVRLHIAKVIAFADVSD